MAASLETFMVMVYHLLYEKQRLAERGSGKAHHDFRLQVTPVKVKSRNAVNNEGKIERERKETEGEQKKWNWHR